MEFHLKHALIFITSCFLLSFGVLCADVATRIPLNRTFQADLKQLNKLSQEKTELLIKLRSHMNQPKYGSVASHLLALEQKNPQYQYENIVFLHDEQTQLQNFYMNFVNNIGTHLPGTETLSLALLSLEENIIRQRIKVLDDLSLLTQ